MEVEHEAEDAGGYATDLGEDFYRQEQDILAPHVRTANIVVTTALIPGRAAPRLITEEMVESMVPGSVIVDLAAVAGGNCVLTRPGETVEHGAVRVMAPLNLPAELPEHASLMFARNAATFVEELIADGELKVDADNAVVAGTLITRDGRIVHEAVRTALTESETR
jgi:NAD(P) transhydrogenase subunit alpha